VRLLVYSLLRVLLVLVSAGVLYLLGMRSWLLWLAAVIIGALLSYLLLRTQGRAAAEVISQLSPLREERPKFSEQVEADAAYEDGLVDEAEHGAAPATTAPGEPGDSAAPAAPGDPAGVPPAAERSTLEREPEAEAEEDAVGQLEQPGVPEHHDEVAARGTAEDHPGDAHRPRDEEQHQQRPR
jgi:hypothetical protein